MLATSAQMLLCDLYSYVALVSEHSMQLQMPTSQAHHLRFIGSSSC